MSNARLMKPLFYDGNFNRDGKKMRAVFEREISDGTVSYRLWRSDGKPDIQYPRAENDIEALITQPSAGVVLVNPDEQPFQFSDAVFVPFQPFPSDADLLTAFQPELFLHHCTEMCLMPQNVARHSLNVFQDYVAEYGFPDVMSTALVLVLLMERTVKERALG